MRIAMGGIAIECCTFSPLMTDYNDFRLSRGADIHQLYPFLPTFGDVTWLPLLRARALPGGVVKRTAYEAIKTEFLALLKRVCPVDGVYLDMHGAMNVEGLSDAEADWFASVRQVVGDTCLISASYDLHGNLSQSVARYLDILTAYRTAPHIDIDETRERACYLMVNCLRENLRPHITIMLVPLLLSGEKATTDRDPTARLYQRLPHFDEQTHILDTSLLIGYAWADEPRVGASVVAVGTDKTQTQRVVIELARELWDARRDFHFGMATATVDECIEIATHAEQTPFFISDAGDNVTGGGVGDVPYVLQLLLAQHVQGALFASIVDAQAVEDCFNCGVNSDIALYLGGKLDTRHGMPLSVYGSITKLICPQSEHRQAVIQIDGIHVIVTEKRTAFTTLQQFYDLDLDPLHFKIVVVKLGYLFPELKAIARDSILAYSPGALNPVVESIGYQHLKRPIYPLESDMIWQPTNS
jgi:microcystin degradation protein MlrC